MDDSPCNLRELLKEEKERIEKRLDEMGNEGCRVEAGNGNSYDADLDTNHELQQVFKETLSDISEALQRTENDTIESDTIESDTIESDTIVCVDCQEEIPRERLLSVPHTERCTPCQAAHDKKKSGRRHH